MDGFTPGSSKRDFFDTLAYRIILTVTFFVPIFFLPISFFTPQFGTSLLFSAGVIVSCMLYIIAGLVYGSIELPKESRYIIGFTVLVPIVYVVAGISHGFSRLAFFGYTFDIDTIGFMVIGFGYLFLVSLLFKHGSRIFYAYFSFVLSSVILTIFLIIRILFGAKFLSFGIFNKLTSTMVGSWNNVGIFFGICVILSLLTIEMVNVSRIMKVILMIALLSSLFFLATVNFMAVWIILAVTSFFFTLYRMFSHGGGAMVPPTFGDRIRTISRYSALVLLTSIVFSVGSSSIGGFLSKKMNVTSLEVRPSLEVTFAIAKNTLTREPLFGSGPNTFVNQWLFYRPSEITSTVFWNIDFTTGVGLIPTLAVTTGIIGLLSWFLFLGFILYLGIKAIFSRTHDSFSKYLLVSSFFVTFYLWVMAFVYVPSIVIFILTLFFTGLFFAAVYRAGLIKTEDMMLLVNPKTGFISSIVFVGCMAICGTLAYGIYKNSKSLWHYQRSSYELSTNGNISASEKHLLTAIDSVPYDAYFRALSNVEVLKLNAVASQDAKQVKTEVIQKQFKDVLSNAIKAGIAATQADPSNYLNWIALGQVYEAVSAPELKIDAAYDSAQYAYGEALKRNPKNPSILMFLARLASTHGDYKTAKEYVSQAIAEKRNYLDAYFLLSQIEVADKNLKGAIDSVAAASVIDPTNPAIFFQLGLLKYNSNDYRGAIEALTQAISITPDYANAKYFLGLSYEATGDHEKAIMEFQDLKRTNPESKEVESVLTNLLAGKPLFQNGTTTQPEKGKTLPVKEKVQ